MRTPVRIFQLLLALQLALTITCFRYQKYDEHLAKVLVEYSGKLEGPSMHAFYVIILSLALMYLSILTATGQFFDFFDI